MRTMGIKGLRWVIGHCLVKNETLHTGISCCGRSVTQCRVFHVQWWWASWRAGRELVVLTRTDSARVSRSRWQTKAWDSECCFANIVHMQFFYCVYQCFSLLQLPVSHGMNSVLHSMQIMCFGIKIQSCPFPFPLPFLSLPLSVEIGPLKFS